MNEAKEKNGGPETKSTNKKKKQGAQVKIYKGKKKSIKKNSDATPVILGAGAAVRDLPNLRGACSVLADFTDLLSC